MLTAIDSFTTISALRARVAWTAAAAELVSWVFVNGRLSVGNFRPGTTARSTEITLEDGMGSIHVEVQDLPEGEEALATRPVDGTRPTLRWVEIEAAERYAVMQRQEGGTEAEIKITNATDRAYAEMESPKRLDGQGGQWHFLRVEAIDVRAHRSTRAAWSHRVMEPPAAVAVGAADGSAPGLFTFTIGA